MTVRLARRAGTRSIARAMQVLRELASHNRVGLRLSDVVAQTALEPPTARRILKGLIGEGMVVQNSSTRRYFLGNLVYELGLAATPGSNFRDLCRPALERLANATGDTIFLNRDRKKPHGSSLPHHRAYGSRTRRFDELNS